MEQNGSLISTDQLLYHDELKNQFQQIQSAFLPLLDIREGVSESYTNIAGILVVIDTQ